MTYDVVVIGAGPGGYVAAIRAAQLGLKVASVEKRAELGGTCLNVGCIPSKALLHSSEWFWKLQKEGAERGIAASGLSYDWNKIQGQKENVVLQLTKGIEGLFKKHKVERFLGTGVLRDAHTVAVGSEILQAKSIILATGSEPISLPFLLFDEKKILSSTGALALSSVPKKLLIVGAGVIGLEFGSVYSRLGSEVVFIEFLDRICPGFDEEISKQLLKILTAQGMTFHLSHKVVSAKGTSLMVESGGKTAEMSGDAVLVAIGRKPYSEGLGLESAGIQKTAKGQIVVDSSFRTTQSHIFAIGDLIDGPMLAHKASEEGAAVAELIAGHKVAIDYLAIPNVAYTFPEVAFVGLTEEELKARNIAYNAGKFPYRANSRARCLAEEDGFVKLLADAKSHRLLGAHILGPHASELIGEATLAVQKRATVDEIARACHPHPTLSEAIKEAALAVFGSSIHI